MVLSQGQEALQSEGARYLLSPVISCLLLCLPQKLLWIQHLLLDGQLRLGHSFLKRIDIISAPTKLLSYQLPFFAVLSSEA